jgi:CTP synthase (UTP-ammonia lyase)
VVTQLSCTLFGKSQRVIVLAGSRAAQLYGRGEAIEDYYCSYGLNPDFRQQFEQAGLRVSGVDDDGQVRIVELKGHPFFLATLFCFQTRSRADQPHPLVAGFVQAARQVALR